MQEINERKRFLYLFLIMVAIAIGVGGSVIFLLYETSFEQQRERLVEMAKSQARLIEAVARFDNNADATLSQLVDAHSNYNGFGRTGEFVLAKLEEGYIVFLLSHRHDNLDNPKPVSINSELAEPMRRALLGQIGTIVGKDYRGTTVLASYESVDKLNYGIVAKVDLAEIRQPFIHAGIIAGVVTLVLVGIGAYLFFQISEPILKHLEQKNKLLCQEIEERAQIQEHLATSLEEKDILLKEIHHRVKNNMAMVSSLLHLQALEIENPDDRRRFIDTQNRIYTIALVHERLYSVKDFSRIDFDRFIQEISDAIQQSYASICDIVVTVETHDVLLDLNKAIPCGLLINELISNSFKHAFSGREQGKINVLFRRDAADRFELVVSDDGIGLPDNFDINKAQSMGMKLILRLTEQLDGEIAVSEHQAFTTGTTFDAVF